MTFTPEQEESKAVPYYEDVAGSDGWEGFRSEKSIERLKKEIGEAVGRLGGFVSGYNGGVFLIGDLKRPGVQLHYSINGIPARLDIAALPTRNSSNREKSLRMALYMVRNGLRGLWFFQQLSPGFAPLMPFMIANKDGDTLSQVWARDSSMRSLLPPSDSDFIEAEEVK
jgi:hypothetical protein